MYRENQNKQYGMMTKLIPPNLQVTLSQRAAAGPAAAPLTAAATVPVGVPTTTAAATTTAVTDHLLIYTPPPSCIPPLCPIPTSPFIMLYHFVINFIICI